MPGRVRGARLPRAGYWNSGRFAHGTAWGPRPRGASWRCPSGTWILLQLQIWGPHPTYGSSQRFPYRPSQNVEALRARRAAFLPGPPARDLSGFARWAAVARKSALAAKRAALLERTGSAQTELVVSRVLLEPWGSHQSPSPWSYSSGSWRGWPWSSDPTPTRPWCQPRRLGQRRKALQPWLPIPGSPSPHPTPS